MRCCSSLLGWLEVHGVLAMVVIAVLVAEIVITLMDFVEEDLSRKLPASERINHTLLALNYGAILVLLLPVLIGWAMRPAGDQAGRSRLARHRCCGRRGRRSGVRRCAISRRRGAWRACSSAPAKGLVEKAPASARPCSSPARPASSAAVWSPASSAAGHQVIALVRNPAKAEMLAPPITLITSLDQLPADTPDRCDRQSRRRADRQRPVDRGQAPQDRRVPAST